MTLKGGKWDAKAPNADFAGRGVDRVLRRWPSGGRAVAFCGFAEGDTVTTVGATVAEVLASTVWTGAGAFMCRVVLPLCM